MLLARQKQPIKLPAELQVPEGWTLTEAKQQRQEAAQRNREACHHKHTDGSFIQSDETAHLFSPVCLFLELDHLNTPTFNIVILQ